MTAFTFVGVWPIVEPMPRWVLIEEAQADLPKVLARHHAEITGPIGWSIRSGASTPGSGGAASVVYCEAPAVRTDRRQIRPQVAPGPHVDNGCDPVSAQRTLPPSQQEVA